MFFYPTQSKIRDEPEQVEANPRPAQRPRLDDEKMSTKIARESCYWNSPEAKHLFFSEQDHQTDEGRAEKDRADRALKRRIAHLQNVTKDPEGWRHAIYGHDHENKCTPFQINWLRQKCQLLCLSYIYAQDEMNQATWAECCQKACDPLNQVGICAATHGGSIERWHRLFRMGAGMDRRGTTLGIQRQNCR